MAEKEINQKVFKIVSQVMNIPEGQVNEGSSADTIEQWDSLQHMNLVLALEQQFKIKFTEDELASMTDIKSILKALSAKNIS